MPDLVQDIRSRIQIEEVVASYVQLKRAGRSLKGLCPWHAEKTPSFVVSPERQLAYCFGCSRGGDVFSFIEEIEGVDFRGAIEILAERVGLSPSDYESSFKAPKVSRDEKEELYHANEEAAKFYKDQLHSTKEGQKVMMYLEDRGMTAETVESFALGLAPDSYDATFNYLVQKKCTKRALLDVGLLSSKDTSSEKTYDKFRLRLMFPIWDGKGKIVGFGGRALKKEDQPKYMNSPETPIYHKGDVLYGFYRAKKAIRAQDLAIVVEGYMDVMASYQAGIANVVASSGTALTESQLKLIKRFTKNVAFSFDTDSAGEDALRRAVELGQHLKINMKVVRVPNGKDPADCVKEDPELWRTAVLEAPFYLDYYLSQVPERFEVTTIQGKKSAADYFLPLLKAAESIERDHYLKQLAFVLQVDTATLYDQLNQFKKDPYAVTRKAQGVKPRGEQDYSKYDYFLGLLLRFPGQITEEALAIPEGSFPETLKNVYSQVVSQYTSRARVDAQPIFDSCEPAVQDHLNVLMMLAETRNADLSEEMMGPEMVRVVKQLLKHDQEAKRQTLMRQIREAQSAQDADRERELFQEYSRLLS